jgi:threonine dehydratase
MIKLKNMIHNNIYIKTPLQYNNRLSQKYNCEVYLKREDLQTVRSFKVRGAYNKILNATSHELQNGVVCASAGNHAQGVAHVCKQLNIKCDIYVPIITPLQKINKIKQYGNNNCNLIIIGDKFDDCLIHAKEYSDINNKLFIHPFDDNDVINGQGEILDEINQEINPDMVICTIGGGGLISGLLKKNKNSEIIGVEPSGAAAMYNSLKNGINTKLETLDTFVDGASVNKVGDLTFDICKKMLNNNITLIDNGELCHEIVQMYQIEGIIVEPAGILSICALSHIDKNKLKNKKTVCIISGGNNDILRYGEIVEKNLIYLGLRHYFIIELKQKPGQLKKYILEILGNYADIIRFEYVKKNNRYSGTVLVGIDVDNKNTINIIMQNMQSLDYKFTKIEENDLIYSLLL